MKKLFLFSLLPLLLGSCTPIDFDNGQHGTIGDETTETGDSGNQTIEEEEKDDEGETGSGQGQQGQGTTTDHHQDSQAISLDNYMEFEFHDGHKPAYNEAFDFYYGTTHEPLSSCFFECPNEDLDYSGIKFYDKKEYLISPNFKSYKKVEVRFQFWISAKSSDKYKYVKNQPTFNIEEYNSSNTLLATEGLTITKSDVHTNNTPTEKTMYIKQNTMTSFVLRFNNFIENTNDRVYMPVLTKITLKGWDYE